MKPLRTLFIITMMYNNLESVIDPDTTDLTPGVFLEFNNILLQNKITLENDNIQLFVTSSSSGEGKESLPAKYNSENLTVSFNARYLLDIASQIEDENLIMNLNDAISPVLIQDKSDNQSYYVIMPMKI